ncbi:PLAC8 family protein [Actinidia rufa]|uniref:PLAC8 family protein n=1 Tax=Actinidia rufa TaxID=165716 RepID=A0A7J0D9Z6_9ERIC|nr:PLAC8 family protein [Actinidia rufa]
MAEMETEKGLGAAAASAAEGGEEEERLLEGMMVLDFDMLCSTVAMQTQGKWTKLDQCDDDFEHGGGELGGVLRMWEGELLDCFDDRRIALESACCPCYRFGKNMGRAGFGSCFVQESRTLDMNNVQDGTWHGRGDTICIGGYGEGSKVSFELHPPPVVSTNSVDPCTVQISINVGDHSWDSEVGHCTAPLVTQS